MTPENDYWSVTVCGKCKTSKWNKTTDSKPNSPMSFAWLICINCDMQGNRSVYK